MLSSTHQQSDQGFGHSGYRGGSAQGDDHKSGQSAPPQVQTPAGAPQKDDHYLVKGATGCYNRLEIHDFIKNEKFFSLYIQALNAAYTKLSPNNVESFFQIGGIHGRPHVDYAGATGFDGAGNWGGYCTHSTILFPTWHRPYVMLLEQVLQKQATEIAATYTVDRDAWKQAAIALRQPYWDWAIHSSPPQEVIFMKQVTITDLHGKRVPVNNPLYCYPFPSNSEAEFEGNFQTWPTTLRCPTSADADSPSDPITLQKNLDTDGPNVRKTTYTMLSQIFDWAGFATHAEGELPGRGNSLEAIHDGIHFKIGGMSQVLKGHMGDNDVAAFDPIFFLHHANVDRLLSIWAALNPNVWVTPGNSGEGTVTIPADSIVDTKTKLSPFWKTSTTFWISTELQNTVNLGYSYPEFDGLNLGNPQAVRIAIAQKVNALYGAVLPIPVPGTPAPAPAPPSGSCPDHGAWDWAARVHIKKYDVGTSFVVVFFLGEVPKEPKEWTTSNACVGRHYVMVNSNPQNCANCKTNSNVTVEGFVHLNDGLNQHLGSLAPEKVAQYLKDKLQWRVQKIDGTPATAESLEVIVVATPLSYPVGTLFPVPGKPRQYDSCTRGRVGGSRQTGNF